MKKLCRFSDLSVSDWPRGKYPFDVAWANLSLRVAIAELKSGFSESLFVWCHSVQTVLVIKDLLVDFGLYGWQLARVQNWLYFYMRRRRQFTAASAADSPPEVGGERLLKTRGIQPLTPTKVLELIVWFG